MPKAAIHPPEVCLRGEGSRITGQRNQTVRVSAGPNPDVELVELAVESGGRLHLYWYTYKVGPAFTSSFVKQQWLIWWNGLLRRQVGGALIRLSTTVRRGGLSTARSRLLQFSQAVLPHIVAKLRVQPSASR